MTSLLQVSVLIVFLLLLSDGRANLDELAPSQTDAEILPNNREARANEAFRCPSEGFHEDKQDCAVFYRCVDQGGARLTAFRFQCGPGTVYDPQISACNHPRDSGRPECGGASRNENELESLNQINTGPGQTQGNQWNQTGSGNTGSQQHQTGQWQQSSNSSHTSQTNQTTQSSQWTQSTHGSENTQNWQSSTQSSYWTQSSQSSATQSGQWSQSSQSSQGSQTEQASHTSQDSHWSQGSQSSQGSQQWQTTESGSNNQNSQGSGSSQNLQAGSNSSQGTHSNQEFQNLGSSCHTDGFLGDDKNCQVFYRCVDNGRGGYTKYEFKCGDGTVWDPESNSCNHAWAVNRKDCKSISGSNSLGSTSGQHGNDQWQQQQTNQSTQGNQNNQINQGNNNWQSGSGSQSGSQGSQGSHQQTGSQGSGQNQGSQGTQNSQSNSQSSGQYQSSTNHSNTGNTNESENSYTTQATPTASKAPGSQGNQHSQQNQGLSGTNNSQENQSSQGSSQSNSQQGSYNQGSGNTGNSQGNQGSQQKPTGSQGSQSSTQGTNSSNNPYTEAGQSGQQSQGSQNNNNNIGSKCVKEGFLTDDKDCKVFYRCVDDGRGGFTKYDFKCGDGTVWDPEISSCNHAWAVNRTNCASVSNPPSTDHGSTNGQVSQEHNQSQQQHNGHGSDGSQGQESGSGSSGSGQGSQGAQNYQTTAKTPPVTESGISQGQHSQQNQNQGSHGSNNSQGSQSSHGNSQSNGEQGSSNNQGSGNTGHSQEHHGSEQQQTANKPSSSQGGQGSSEGTNNSNTHHNEGGQNGQQSQESQNNNNNIGSKCVQEGFLADDKDCKIFYRCVDNGRGGFTKYDFKCGDGTIFDPEISSCNHAWAVKRKNCSSLSDSLSTGNEQSHQPQNGQGSEGTQGQQSGTGSSENQGSHNYPTTTKTPSTSETSGSHDSHDTSHTHENQNSQGTSQSTSGSTPSNGSENNPSSNGVTSKPTSNYVDETQGTSGGGGAQNNQGSPSGLGSTCKQEGFLGDDQDCKIFYRCVSNEKGGFTKYEFKCGEGTLWDTEISACNHDWAVNRDGCKKSPNQQVQSSSEQPNSVLTSSPSSSSTVTESSSNSNQGANEVTRPTSGHGPENTQNNQGTHGNGQKPTTTQTPSISSERLTTSNAQIESSTQPQDISKPGALGSTCTKEGFLGDEADCKKFYRCVDNGKGGYTKYDFNCGEGTVWDPEIEGCNHAWAVTRNGCTTNQPGSGSSGTNEHLEQSNQNSTSSQGSTGSQSSQGTEGSIGSPTTKKPDPSQTTSISQENQTTQSNKEQTNSSGNENTAPTHSSNGSTNKPDPRPDPSPVGSECTQDGFLGDDKNCKKFYRCVDNGRGGFTKHEFSCGEGTVWDPEIQGCNHAWAVNRVGCTSTSTSSGGTGEISENPKDINETQTTPGNQQSQGTNISNGSGSSESTTGYPSKETFPPPQGSAQGNQNYHTTTEAIKPSPESGKEGNKTDSEPQIGSQCQREGFLGDDKNCKKFYRCVDNGRGGLTKYEFSCGEGTVWDPDTSSCNHAWAVNRPDCKSDGGSPISSENNETSQGSSSGQGGDGSQSHNPSGNGQGTQENQSSSQNETSQGPSGGQGGNGSQLPHPSGNGHETQENQGSSQNETSQGTSSKEEYNESNASQTNSESSENASIPVDETNGHGNQGPQLGSKCSESGFLGDDKNCKKFYRCVENGKGGFTRYEFNCGDGTVWDPEILSCNHEWAVSREGCSRSGPSVESTSKPEQQPTGKPTESSGTESTGSSPSALPSSTPSTTQSEATTKTPPPSSGNSGQNKCTSEGFHPHPEDCKKFYRCVDNGKGGFTKYDFSCGDGTFWDTEISSCNHEWAVNRPECPNSSGSENSPSTKPNTTSPPRETEETTIPTKNTTPRINKSSTSPKVETTTSSAEEVTSSTSSNSPIENGKLTSSSQAPETSTSYTQKPETSAPIHEQTPKDTSTATPDSGSSSTESTSSVPSCTNSTNTAQNGSFTCTEAGFYPHPTDCKKYYRCVDWDGDKGQRFSIYKFDCPEGTIWDPALDTCNHEDSVYPPRDCSASPASPKPQGTTTESSASTTGSTEALTDTTTLESVSTTSAWIKETTTNSAVEMTETTTPETATTTTVAWSTPSSEITTTSASTTTDNPDQPCEGNSTDQTTTTEEVAVTTTTETTTTIASEVTTTDSSSTGNETTDAPCTTPLTTDIPPTTETSSGTETTTAESITTTVSTDTTITATDTTTANSDCTTASTDTTTTATDGTTTGTDTTTTSSGSTTDSEWTTTDGTTDTTTTRDHASTTDGSETTTATQETNTTNCPIANLEADQVALVCPTGFRRHPKYCNLFYQCTTNPNNYDMKILVLSCPNDTIYDDSKVQCLPPQETDQECEGQMATSTFYRKLDDNSLPPVPVRSARSLCPSEGHYALEDNNVLAECGTSFITCSRSVQAGGAMRGFVFQCPRGFVYWPVSRRCERSSRLPKCSAGTDHPQWSSRWDVPVEHINVSF